MNYQGHKQIDFSDNIDTNIISFRIVASWILRLDCLLHLREFPGSVGRWDCCMS